MAFIVPVIRRDFPLYTQRQPTHSLALHKRRSESMPIDFQDNYLPVGLPKMEEIVQAPASPNSPLFNVSPPPPPQLGIGLQQQPISPSAEKAAAKCTRREWLFPNQRVSFSRLDDDGFLETPVCDGRPPRRRVHFGMCERVEYDREEEEEKEGPEEGRNIGHGQKRGVPRRRRASIPARRTMEEQGQGQPTSPEVLPANPSPTIQALTLAGEGKENEATLDLLSAKGKYNAVFFRLMSSLCTSKM